MDNAHLNFPIKSYPSVQTPFRNTKDIGPVYLLCFPSSMLPTPVKMSPFSGTLANKP